MGTGTRFGAALLLTAAASAGLLAQTFFEDFSSMPVGHCHPDGSTEGAWRFVYDGYGCNTFARLDGNTTLFQQPKAATAPGETHAALVLGPAVSGDLSLEVVTATSQQLRSGSAPNAWEVGWLLWHYRDDRHFYYFVAKPNGWELGKADPAYPGAQRFLATGSSPTFPIGSWYRLRVTQAGNTIRVFANDLLLATFTDGERPYSSGWTGLYAEDAAVYFDNVAVTATAAPGRKGKKK